MLNTSKSDEWDFSCSSDLITQTRKEVTMRQKLKEIGTETRERYKGTVGRCGIKYNGYKGWPERTVVLNDLISVNTGEKTTDHIWLTVGKTLAELDLKAGDEITFNARVGTYRKGKHFNKKDYKLNRLTHIEVARIDREISEDEITTGKPATFQEWQDIQDMKYLEKEYSDESIHLHFDFEFKDVERLKELKELFSRRYFEAKVKTA